MKGIAGMVFPVVLALGLGSNLAFSQGTPVDPELFAECQRLAVGEREFKKCLRGNLAQVQMLRSDATSKQQPLSASELPPLYSYDVDGQGYLYRSENQRCEYGGHPSKEQISSLLDSPEAVMTAEGFLAILRCDDRDVIVRVSKPDFQRLVIKYSDPRRVEDGYKLSVSTWPLRNSPGYDRSVLQLAYPMVEKDGKTLIDNGHEYILLVNRGNPAFLDHPELQAAVCQTEVPSFMIPKNRTGYFPGETASAYANQLEEAIFNEVPTGALPVRSEFCHGGLYIVLLPVFQSNSEGNSG